MKQTGLLPVMALNLSSNGVGSLFVMDEDILPESMLQKVDNLDSTTMDYILENRIYCSQVTPAINLAANDVSLSLSTPTLPYSGTVGKEFNQDFLAVKTPVSAGDSTTTADFLNVLVYTPKNVIHNVTSYSTASNTVSLPLSYIGANTDIKTSFSPNSIGQMVNLVPNDTNSNLSFIMSESFDAWRQSRGYLVEVNFKDAISTDIVLFKCGLSPGASYRPAWNSWTLRLFYYDETTLTWTAIGNSYIPGSHLIAYQMNSITAKRFRFYVGGSFEGTSGSVNVTTRLGLSKFAFGKKNTAIPSVQYSPRTAVFFPSNSLTDLASYVKKFGQSKSVNAVILSLGEDEFSVVDLLVKPDPFEDGSTLATLPLDGNVESTYKPVFANTLVDMENALTYIANNNYLGRTVINNNGAFSAHGPLNEAFSATMDAGAGRQWRMKDIVIKDNAVAVPTYPNNPRVHWYVSNDNVTYTPLFTSESALGERLISLPVEVFARFVRIQHDTHPSNTYQLSGAIYSDNSIAIYERANVVAVGSPTYIVGKFGHALKGNGSSSKINTDINITALDNWAISFHADNLMSGSGSILGSGISLNNFYLNKDDVVFGRLALVVSSGGSVLYQLAPALTDNNFHHIVLNCSARIISMYIDGILAITVNKTIVQTTDTLSLLTDGSNWRFFNGAIDQVRVFNRALSTTEIDQLKIESIVTKVGGSQGELSFYDILVAGRRVTLAPNSNAIGAEI